MANTLPFIWRKPSCSNPQKLCDKIESVCKSWENTPYSRIITEKGKGASCSGFVFSVLDDLHKIQDKLINVNTLKNTELTKMALKRYIPCNRVSDTFMEPGDIIVFKKNDDYSAHLFLVGGKRNHIWHADYPGVVLTGISINKGISPHAIFRSANKESWLP